MMPQFVITYTHMRGCKCASCVDPESSQIFIDLGIGEGTRFPFDIMPTTTFGELKEKIATYIEENAADISEDVLNEGEFDFEPTVQKVEAARHIYVDDVNWAEASIRRTPSTRQHLEIAHDTLVLPDLGGRTIARHSPICHGCILTLMVDDQNDSAFKVELDPDYK